MFSPFNKVEEMSPTKVYNRPLPTLLTLISIVTLFAILSEQIPTPRERQSALVGRRCILYDRPPRTGSTTISRALARCVTSNNYSVARLLERKRTTAVESMVSLSGSNVAAVRTHIALSAHDLIVLRQQCENLLYITSCAPMKKRLFSAVKRQISVSGEAKAKGMGNSSVTDNQMKRVYKLLQNTARTESFLEAYPYVSESKTALEVTPQRLVPDYVIRRDRVERDLGSMLESLGCESAFSTENVHESHVDESGILQGIELKMEDKVYEWLAALGEANDKGLEKARTFASTASS